MPRRAARRVGRDARATRRRTARTERQEDDLSWDDDELETQIYDDDGAPKPRPANQPGGVGARSVMSPGGDDHVEWTGFVVSLVSTGQGAGKLPRPRLDGPRDRPIEREHEAANGANGTPPPFANGSNKVRAPSDPRLAATLLGEPFVPNDPNLLSDRRRSCRRSARFPRSTDLRESAIHRPPRRASGGSPAVRSDGAVRRVDHAAREQYAEPGTRQRQGQGSASWWPRARPACLPKACRN